jgi:precorrin-3B synthase
VNAPHRRGACPGLSAPMLTGDGLLVRLTPSGRTIVLDTFAALCAAARQHGNGIIEITSRGNIQFRGLSASSARAFAAAVQALDIDVSDGIPVLSDPLSGLDPDERLNAGELAKTLRAALTAAPFAARLSPKTSVIVDSGGALHLDHIVADIRLRAVVAQCGPCLHIALGGDAATAVPIGVVPLPRAVDGVLGLLALLAARGPRARMRHAIDADGISVFKSAVTDFLIDEPPPAARAAAEPIGIHPLRSGVAAIGIGLPFGHSNSEALAHLIDAARSAGAGGVRTAPGRALLIVGISPAVMGPLAAAAEGLGFIVNADDPRRKVVACAGAPICASGQIPARAIAPEIAKLAGALLADDVVHISGCPKGCAHPGPAFISVYGRDGVCDVHVDGALTRSVPVDALPGQIVEIIQSRAKLKVEHD